MNRKVLFVDDEPHLLEGIRRVLRQRFEIEVAACGRDGLAALAARGPFAVVVSDLRMPQMDGVEFLSRCRAAAPDAVRVMLTGFADVERAMAAVNEGNIFRFLTKPCPPGPLGVALQAACEQHDLITAERELLEHTLSGAVALLTEVLELVNPVAFGRAMRIRPLVAQLSTMLQIPDAWRSDLAAMLSQLGCITLPPDTLGRYMAGQSLDALDADLVAEHPAVGARLLSRIPRLESVARIVAAQRPEVSAALADRVERIGGEIVRAALAVDEQLLAGEPPARALAHAARNTPGLSPEVADAIGRLTLVEPETQVRVVTLRELTLSMVLDEDVKARNGLVLLSRGQMINATALERLRTFARGVGVVEPFRVREPQVRPVRIEAAAGSGRP